MNSRLKSVSQDQFVSLLIMKYNGALIVCHCYTLLFAPVYYIILEHIKLERDFIELCLSQRKIVILTPWHILLLFLTLRDNW